MFIRPAILALVLGATAAQAQSVPCGGSFSGFVSDLQQEAVRRGHDPQAAARFFGQVSQDQSVLRADRRAMLIELFHRNDDTPVGADLFEADDFSDLTTEQRIRRRMPIQRRR